MPPTNVNIKILAEFEKNNVRYVLVGVYALNHYTNDPGNAFFTQDCDILVDTKPKNILTVLLILQKAGFHLEVNKEPLVVIDEWLAKKIIEHCAVITARKKNEVPIDIITSAGKIPFFKWYKSRQVFTIGKTPVQVGNILHLIRAKEQANREKDKIFLKLYKVQLKEIIKSEHQKNKRNLNVFTPCP